MNDKDKILNLGRNQCSPFLNTSAKLIIFNGNLNIKNNVVKHDNWIRIKKEGIENTCWRR